MANRHHSTPIYPQEPIIFSPPSDPSSHLPPTPISLPIIGHLHLLGPLPHQALAKLSSRYGPLIHLQLGSLPCLVVSSPETAKEFLKTHETYFSDRPVTVATDYMSYSSQDFLVANYGPYWKFMKKICMSQLLNGPTLEILQPIRCGEIKNLVAVLFVKAKNGESIDIRSELIRMTNNLISRMIMSERCSGDEENGAEDVRNLVREVTELTGKFNLSDYIWFCKNLDLQGFGKRMKEVRARFDKMMEKIIDEHEEKRRRMLEEKSDGVKDLLDILLDIAADGSSEFKLTREKIKAFVLDLFAAGTDTSALTVEWALSELINHPNILQKAVQELDSVVGPNRLVQESDIPKLPYLQSIVKETFRLHPTVPLIPRHSNEDCTILGYRIPAKTWLYINMWAIGRDPQHWESPLEFRPERFFSEDRSLKGQLDVRGQHFHLLPFGTGRRACPDTSLALQVVQTTLAAMIQCFDWRVENGKVDMGEGPGITAPRAQPLICFPLARISHVL